MVCSKFYSELEDGFGAFLVHAASAGRANPGHGGHVQASAKHVAQNRNDVVVGVFATSALVAVVQLDLVHQRLRVEQAALLQVARTHRDVELHALLQVLRLYVHHVGHEPWPAMVLLAVAEHAMPGVKIDAGQRLRHHLAVMDHLLAEVVLVVQAEGFADYRVWFDPRTSPKKN